MEIRKTQLTDPAIFLLFGPLQCSKRTRSSEFKIAERLGLTFDFPLVLYSLPSFLINFLAFLVLSEALRVIVVGCYGIVF